MIIIKFTSIEPKQDNEFFDEVNNSYLSGIVDWQLASGIRPWSPPYDLIETDSDYILRVEIAGMQEENFNVSFDSKFIYVTGRRYDDLNSSLFHQMEIAFGEFSFKVAIPGKINSDRIQGEYANGFLVITLPKLKKGPYKLDTDSNE